MTNVETWLLSYLLNSLWQVPLLFVAGWLGARVLKPLGAKAEHRLWVGVLLLQSFLPAASMVPSSMFEGLPARLSGLLARLSGAARSNSADVSIVLGAGNGVSALHLPPGLLTAIAIAYFIATAYFAARFLWRCNHLRILRRESTPIALTGEAAEYWALSCDRFGVDDASIAASSRIRGPVTIGLYRKLLLLPATMIKLLHEADLTTVMAHEFAHMRRNDFVKNLMYELLAVPISYHPALWSTRERIMATREVVCDQMAAPIEGRNEYARSLLRLASLLVAGMPTRTPHAIGIFDANAFERRIMMLAQKPIKIGGPRRFALVAACAALGLAVCASAIALRLPANALPGADDQGTSTTPDSLTVPAGEMAGHVISKKTPVYPIEAKKERIEGTVKLNAVISRQGNVEELNVISGPNELQQSSLDAVREWTYKPYLVNGDPVEVKTTISVVYTLAR